MSDVVKMTVNVTQEAAEALRSLAEKQGVSMTNIVNKAIALEKYMYDEVAKGGEVQISQKDGKVKAVFIRSVTSILLGKTPTLLLTLGKRSLPKVTTRTEIGSGF